MKVVLDSAKPSIRTVMEIYPAADWYEREMAEMFGVEILGRKAKRLLLEGWDGGEAPLRKGFAWGGKGRRI